MRTENHSNVAIHGPNFGQIIASLTMNVVLNQKTRILQYRRGFVQ